MRFDEVLDTLDAETAAETAILAAQATVDEPTADETDRAVAAELLNIPKDELIERFSASHTDQPGVQVSAATVHDPREAAAPTSNIPPGAVSPSVPDVHWRPARVDLWMDSPRVDELVSRLQTLRPGPAGVLGSHLRHGFEATVRDNHYVLQAELPGIRPESDLKITAHGGRLTIEVKSPILPDPLVESVMMPAGTNETDVTANYELGVLTVLIPVPDINPITVKSRQ